MTIASDIIQSAYREGNLLPIGTEPTDAEVSEALARLNAIIMSTLGAGMGENLYDWLVPQPQRTAPVAANFPQLPQLTQMTLPGAMPSTIYLYPPKNSRIMWNGTTVTTFFPEQPSDGSRMAIAQGSGLWNGDVNTPQTTITLDGNGRLIDGSPTQSFTNTGPSQQWWYRAELGNWMTVQPVATTDNLPFAPEIDDLWILNLALRLAPRYGKTMPPESVAALKAIRALVAQNYTQQQDTQYNSGDIPKSWYAYAANSGWFS